MIRGSNLGSQWPKCDSVDDDSFMGIMRRKTSLKFDLPTEAQWEYACRAGTTNIWNNGEAGKFYDIYDNGWDNGGKNDALGSLGRYRHNRNDGHDAYTEHTKVGQYLPNAWNIYDMHGNVCEWCLDGYKSVMADYEEMDPVGADSTENRSIRGGCYSYRADRCRSARRDSADPSSVSKGMFGIRLVCLPVE